jgi:hypothetical protein
MSTTPGHARRDLWIAALVLVALFGAGLVAYRPATIVGVEGDALAASMGGFDPGGASRCERIEGDRWSCVISDGSGVRMFAVETL